jgi:hypothetical protein
LLFFTLGVHSRTHVMVAGKGVKLQSIMDSRPGDAPLLRLRGPGSGKSLSRETDSRTIEPSEYRFDLGR